MGRYRYKDFLYDTCENSYHDCYWCSRYHSDRNRCSRCSWYENDGSYEDFDEYCDVKSEYDDFDWDYWSNDSEHDYY